MSSSNTPPATPSPSNWGTEWTSTWPKQAAEWGAPIKHTPLRRTQSSAVLSSVPVTRQIYIYGFPPWVQSCHISDLFPITPKSVEINRSPLHAHVTLNYDPTSAIALIKSAPVFGMHAPLEILFSLKPSTPLEALAEGKDSFNLFSKDTGKDVWTKESSLIRQRSLLSFSSVAALSPPVVPPSPPIEQQESTSIHWGNCPADLARTEIEELFGRYGVVKRVQVVNRPRENRSFAFIGFKDAEGCRNAMNNLRNSPNLHFGMEEPLKLEFSKIEKKKLTDKPPYSMNFDTFRSNSPIQERSGRSSPIDRTQTPPISRVASKTMPISSKDIIKTLVYLPSTPAGATPTTLYTTFSKYGQINLHFIINKPDSTFALFSYSNELMAVNAVEASGLFGSRLLENCTRLKVTGSDIGYFNRFGVDFNKIEGDDGFILEFTSDVDLGWVICVCCGDLMFQGVVVPVL